MNLKYGNTILTALFLLAISSCTTNIHQPGIYLDADLPEAQPLSFAVPEGKQLLIMGQDSDTISAYQTAIPQDTLEGITLYSQLKAPSPSQTLDGILRLGNWGSGDVDFDLSLSTAPEAALAIGLAFDQCDGSDHAGAIARGEYDESLASLIDYLGSLAPRPVFLRIGCEFDGPWNCYPPEEYKAAFRHIVTAIRVEGLTNVASVWHSANWPAPSIAGENAYLYDHSQEDFFERWYPGDDVVDWFGISVFYRDDHQWSIPQEYTPKFAQDQSLKYARLHDKPVIIAEAAPQAYRTGALAKGFITENRQTAVTAEAIWQNWYQAVFDFMRENKDVIKALAYINTHWEVQPMWRCDEGKRAGDPACPQGFWGDSRVQANEYILKQWLKETQNEERWLQGKWW